MALMSVEEWRKRTQGQQKPAESTAPASGSSGSGSSNTGGNTSGGSSRLMSVSEWRAATGRNNASAGSTVTPKTLRSVQDWLNDSSSLLGEIQGAYGSWNADEDQYEGYRSRISNNLAQASSLRRQYAGNEDVIATINDVVAALDQIQDAAFQNRNYYSQWDSAEDYQGYLDAVQEEEEERNALLNFDLDAAAAEIADLEAVRDAISNTPSPQLGSVLEQYRDVLPDFDSNGADSFTELHMFLDALDTQISEKQERANYAKWFQEHEGKYSALPQNDDFRELSSQVSDEPTAGFGIQLGRNFYGFGDKVYDYINDIDGTRESYSASRDGNGGHTYSLYDQMTDEEIATYNYLYNAEGKKAANEYLDYLKYDLNARERLYVQGEMADLATDHPNVANLLSIGANLISGIGTLDIAAQNAMKSMKEAATGEYAGPIDYNTAWTNPSAVSSSIRGTRAQNIADRTGVISLDEEEHPILSRLLNGKSLGDVYQLGMSAVDSLAVAALSPIMGGYSTVLLGGSAATQGILDAVASGATDEQALTLGVLNGAFEMLFEKVSLDNLLKGNTRGIVRTILQQGVVEGSEELSTSFANNIADFLVMAEHSDWRQNIQAYMDAGLSEEEATKEALKDAAIQVGWDFVGGVLTGGLMGGGAAAVNTINNTTQRNAAAKKLYGADLSALIDEALEIDPSNALAKKLKGKLEASRRITGGQIYDLVQQNDAGIVAQDVANIQGRAMERLTELGETGDVHAISAALAKQAAGQKLTRQEQSAISESKYGQRVANELNPENIRSGKYSTAWAEQIDTSRINPEEYSHLVSNAQTAQEPVQTAAGETAAPVMQGPSAASVQPVADTNVGRNVAKGTNVPAKTADAQQTGSVTLENASKKYGAQAKAMITTYNIGGGDQDVAKFDAAYQAAYTVGKELGSLAYVMKSPATAYLTAEQKELAYDAGVDAAGIDAEYQRAYDMGLSGQTLDEVMASDSTKHLTDAQKKEAHAAGVKAAADTATARDARNKRKATGNTSHRKGTVKGENVTIEDLRKTFNDTQEKAYKILSKIAEVTGFNIVLYQSEANEDGKFTRAQGEFRHNDPYTIYLDINAGLSRMSDVGSLASYTMLRTFTHEFVHSLEYWNPTLYNELKKVVYAELNARGENVSDLIDDKVRRAGKDKNGKDKLGYEDASHEVVADALCDILPDANFVETLAEKHKTLFQELLDHLKSFIQSIKEHFASLSKNSPREARALQEEVDGSVRYLENIVQLFDKVTIGAVENMQKTLPTVEAEIQQEVSEDAVPVEDVTRHSYRSLAEAAGFEAMENADGTRMFTRDGAKVTEVTVADIENSPIGAFINFSLEQGDINELDAFRQKKMFADICTMACQTNDFAMTMQFVGSAVFTGMKANADKQYGTTYDFPSICTKTQAVIDAMSAKMVKLGRGLDSEEIVSLYRDVFASGNPVPCPECYVFSRWIGIGGLLDNIKKYQDYYGSMSVADVADAYRKMHAEIEALAKEMGVTVGKAKGALTAKITKEYNKLTEKVEKARNQGERVKGADIDRLEELEPMMNTVKAMTWLEKVYFADSSLTKVNKRFRVPNDVLFDLNNGEAFTTQYPEAWAFRTTQGAGYGKAITPYADASLGEGVLVTNNTTNTIKGKASGALTNYFLQQNGKLDAKARKALLDARNKQKNQAFIGGQRFQSTSDARYENASDYLIAALEMQAMHGMVQVYTKVDGAVPAFSAWGFSINQSLMPLGGGLDANGNVKDTAVGGMNPDIASKNRKNHETAGTITIGVNDNHIRTMFKQLARDFIIPYHASGGKADVVAEFRTIQEGQGKRGKMVRSTDYSRTQSDKVLSDAVLMWQGKTAAQIQRINEIRETRIAILTRGKVDMTVVRSNRFLSALYDKLNGGEWDGVKLARSKVESQIFPNEFWDQTVSYKDSGKITKDYLEYCEDLGFLHRFSGLVPSNGKLVSVNGYDENGNRVQLTDLAYQYDENGQKTDQVEDFFWKVLTDRRMYDNDGNYLPQKVVTLNDTTTDTVTGFAKNNYGRQYNKALSMETANRLADEDIVRHSERVSDDDTLEFLNEQIERGEYITTYKSMRLDGYDAAGNPILHSPMATEINGKYENEYELGQWYQATEHPELIKFDKKNGLPYFELDKGVDEFGDDLGKVPARYNPYEHSSNYVINDQFKTAFKRPNLVVVEMRIPLSETTSGYQAQYAKDPVGWQEWKKGDVASALAKKGKERKVFLSRWSMPVRILSDAEVAKQYRDLLSGTGVTVPNNVVTPTLLKALEDVGVDIDYTGIQKFEDLFVKKAAEREAKKKAEKKPAKKKATRNDSDTVRYSPRDNDGEDAGYAPVFYSQMAKVVDGMKQEKFGADSVVNMLRGKGVKAEEIKWSGIEAWLEGKKSVTKAELQEFIAGSTLQIEEENSANDVDLRYEGDDTYRLYNADGEVLETFKYNAFMSGYVAEGSEEIYTNSIEIEDAVRNEYGDMSMPRWGHYKLHGGKNYRELIFRLPGSSFSNNMMRVHWGDDAEGVLAHARIQDFDTADGKMLFIEEIQSDWHNDGKKSGYFDRKTEVMLDELKAIADERFFLLEDYSTEMTGMAGEWETIEKTEKGAKLLREYRDAQAAYDNAMDAAVKKVPDAPFRDTYHEYVLKRLIRMAAEEGYSSIGWTTADIQSERWSEDYAEGYRIEYDQDIPKFLNKYGKKWGAKVGKIRIGGNKLSLEEELDLAFVEDLYTDEERDGLRGAYEVWSMPITDSMNDSVLYEGQVRYSPRETLEQAAEDLEGIGDTEYLREKEEFPFVRVMDHTPQILLDSMSGEPKYADREIVIRRDALYLAIRDSGIQEGHYHGLGADILKKLPEYIENPDVILQTDDSHKRRIVLASIPAKTGQAMVSVEFESMKDIDGKNEYYNIIVTVFSLKERYLKSLFTQHKAVVKYKREDLSQVNPQLYEWLRTINEKSSNGTITQPDPGVNPNREQQRGDTLTDREVLEMAAGDVNVEDLTDGERDSLRIFNERLQRLRALQLQRLEQGRIYKENTFQKGGNREEATKAKNRMAVLDSQIARAESALLDVEEKAVLKELLRKARRVVEQQERLRGKSELQRWRDRRNNSAAITKYKERIKADVAELNRLLLEGDKKRHVPENLKKAVADALALVNMDTVGAEERIAKYEALIARETDPDKIEAYTVTMENIRNQGEKIGQRLKELRDAYEEISNSTDPDIANAYDPVISGSLQELAGSIGDTSLRDMTAEQLEDVSAMYRMVLTRVRDANKSFLNDKREAISNLASRVVGEVRRVGGEHKDRAAILDPAKKFLWDNQKPIYAMEAIGSDTLTDAFKELIVGEGVYATDVSHAAAFAHEKKLKYKYDSWDFNKKYRFESTSGIEFDLTLEQILSLYAYSKREQAHDHLRLGGFVFDSNIETYKTKGPKGRKRLLKYKVNTADAHQLTPEILANIIGKLSPEQRGFVDEMQEYLSTVMGAKGNEVTMQMYGVKLFKEKFYFPLKSAKQFMFEQNEVSGEVKIKNSGFTNKLVAKANNPVILSNFMDVWAGHVHDMSMYHSFVLPLEDFNRIFNYNSPKTEGQPPVSVKGTIQGAYSPAAVNYVKQLITDLNGGAVTDPRETTAKKLMSNFKKAAVFASLSVSIQQPSAIGRAFAIVDPKYFIGPKMDSKRHKALWSELKQYAPVAAIKEMGYFDTGMGRSAQDFIKGNGYESLGDKAKAVVTDSSYRDEWLSKLPALMDELTWCSIWEAVKRETKAKNKGMDVTSEEFLRIAGSRFTEVITKTQVYDSVLARSGHMRSKGAFMNMWTAFMAEPTTTINMLESAVLQGKRGNKKYAAKVVGAVLASVILNSLLVSLVNAARDDDEDETFIEKYLQSFATKMLDGVNLLTYYPFLKDIWSALQGFDIERADMSLITRLVESITKLVQVYSKDVSDMDEAELEKHQKDLRQAWWGVVDYVTAMVGLPVKNVRRELEAGINAVRTIREDLSGRKTTWGSLGDKVWDSVRSSIPVVGWLPGETAADKLYDATVSGDEAYRERLESAYTSKSALDSAIRRGLRNNDSRIWEAAIAWNDNDLDEYMRIAREIVGERNFSQDNVVMAIRAEAEAMLEAESSSTDKAKGYFTMEKFIVAITQGNDSMASIIRDDIIETSQKNGKTAEEAEDSFNGSARSKLREMYFAGEITDTQVIDTLVDYCGYEVEDAETYAGSLAFEADHPELDGRITYTQYQRWQTDGEPNGVSLEVFTDVAEFRDDGTSNSAKPQEEVAAYIDSLNISTAQKDALWCCFWKRSTLNDAPWH